MFYLGSVAGFLPYILVFSLTLVWGGHAGMPYFTSGSAPEITSEVVKKSQPSVKDIKIVCFEDQFIEDQTKEFLVSFCAVPNLFNRYSFGLFDSADLENSQLRAPPVSLF